MCSSVFQAQSIQSLPRANAAYNSYLDKDHQRSSCFQNTRQQLLGEIVGWITSTDTTKPSIYVLDGIAGIGKSTVAQTIAERCAQLGYLGASFFFSKTENERKTARLFFSTLAFQLCQYKEEFAHKISEALQQKPDASALALSLQLQHLLVEPLQDLPVTHPVVLVLDALDECDETGAVEILRLLAGNLKKISNFKVFITTRPEHHVRMELGNHKDHEQFHLHEIEASIVEADISLYLSHELSPIRVQQELPGYKWQATTEELNMLVQNTGKLFILAVTTIRFILDRVKQNPESQMKKILSALENGKAPGITSVLDQVYLKILQFAVPAHADTEDIDLFQKVVGTIVILEQPLAQKSLATLLGMASQRLSLVLSHLHSIIAPSSSNTAPQIYHKSFTDFITDPARCTDIRLHVSSDKHHAEVAVDCFKIMQTHLHQNMYGLEGLHRLKSNEDIESERLEKAEITEEVAYACTYWATHLHKAGENKNKELVKLLGTFAFIHLLHWLEVLSLLGKLNIGYSALIIAQEYMVGWSLFVCLDGLLIG